MSTYPSLGPSTLEVTPLLPALLFILSTRWLTRLLELNCLEVEEEEFDLPILRVQAPLYRWGPSYSSVFGCLAAISSVAVVLTWARHPLALCLGAGYFIQCLFPLDQHIRSLPIGWWRPSMASVMLVTSLCRSCWGHAALIKCLLEGFCHLRRLGRPVMKTPAGCCRSRPFG
jgi:hypothetical protein